MGEYSRIDRDVIPFYRAALDDVVKRMRANSIDPLDKLPEHYRRQVLSGSRTFENALDSMARYGFSGCSTMFMAPTTSMHGGVRWRKNYWQEMGAKTPKANAADRECAVMGRMFAIYSEPDFTNVYLGQFERYVGTLDKEMRIVPTTPEAVDEIVRTALTESRLQPTLVHCALNNWKSRFSPVSPESMKELRNACQPTQTI